MTLAPWPEKPDYDSICDQTEMNGAAADYYMARADAAMERLRLAVEALQSIERKWYYDEDGIVRQLSTRFLAAEHASQALASIDIEGSK